jgi:hypothetical protein
MNYLREAVDLMPKTLQRIVRGNEVVLHAQMLDDTLADHADSLGTGVESLELNWDTGEDDVELSSLLSVAECAHKGLYPVPPASGFQNRLLHDLMRRAHAQHEGGTQSLWEEKRREIIIGATITSIISAAGVLAYIMYINPFTRRSQTPAGQTADSGSLN